MKRSWPIFRTASSTRWTKYKPSWFNYFVFPERYVDSCTNLAHFCLKLMQKGSKYS